MSMRTDCIYGYGFRVYASDEQLRSFIHKHKNVILCLSQGRELLDYEAANSGESFNPKEDFYDWQNEATGDEGFYGMVADVMYKETGIVFEYRNAQDDDEDDAIILPQTYPWHLNSKEKELTQEKLDELLKVYIDDLGGQLKPDYIRLEYFG